MSNLTIKVEGLKEMRKHLGQAVEGSETIYRNAMFEAVSIVQGRARKNLYKGHGLRTGTLRRSINTRTSLKPIRGIIGVGEKYGEFVEFGTRPHAIIPRGKKALAFKINGTRVVYRKVKHPGTRPIPFMAPAAESSVPPVTDVFIEAVRRVTRLAARGRQL